MISKQTVDKRSGVARVPCALGQKIFLRHLSTKTTKFEVKIVTKVQKKQK